MSYQPASFHAWELSGTGKQMADVTVKATLVALLRTEHVHVAHELSLVFVPVDSSPRLASSRIVRSQCRAIGGKPVTMTAADVARLCLPASRAADEIILEKGMLVTPTEGPLRGLEGRVVQFTRRRVRLRLSLRSLRFASVDRSDFAAAE